MSVEYAPAPLDLDAFVMRLDNDTGFIREMLSQFISQLPNILDRLTQAADQQDADLVKALAHELKGIALNMDAKGLAILGRELELLASNEASKRHFHQAILGLRKEAALATEVANAYLTSHTD